MKKIPKFILFTALGLIALGLGFVALVYSGTLSIISGIGAVGIIGLIIFRIGKHASGGSSSRSGG